MQTLIARFALALPNQCFPFFPSSVQRDALLLMRTWR
jgi:hypothetical protein